MTEEIIFSGHTVITKDKVEVQCSKIGDLMVFFNDEPIFMLDYDNLFAIFKKAFEKREKYFRKD